MQTAYVVHLKGYIYPSTVSESSADCWMKFFSGPGAKYLVEAVQSAKKDGYEIDTAILELERIDLC